jgi:peptide/nickel transport system permease protein
MQATSPINSKPGVAPPARLDLPEAKRPNRNVQVMKRLLRDWLTWIWLPLLIIWVASAAFGPLISAKDPTRVSLRDSFIPPPWGDGGTIAHLLGTDHLGRDMLAMLVLGSRVTLEISATVVLFELLIGCAIGIVAGYYGGWLDAVLMRITDVYIAFPGLLLALFVIAILGPGVQNLILALILSGWTVFARMTRGMTLSLREKEFVVAAYAIGCTNRRIILRHILPNQVALLLTLCSLEVARAVLSESALSFLGLGIQPPDASWGLMIADGRTYLFKADWITTLPGLAIILTVLALTLMTNSIELVTNPKT